MMDVSPSPDLKPGTSGPLAPGWPGATETALARRLCLDRSGGQTTRNASLLRARRVIRAVAARPSLMAEIASGIGTEIGAEIGTEIGAEWLPRAPVPRAPVPGAPIPGAPVIEYPVAARFIPMQVAGRFGAEVEGWWRGVEAGGPSAEPEAGA